MKWKGHASITLDLKLCGCEEHCLGEGGLNLKLFKSPSLDLVRVVEDGSSGVTCYVGIAVSDGNFLGVSGAEDIDGKEGIIIVPGNIEAVEGEGVSTTAKNHLPADEFVILVREGKASSQSG